MGTQRIGLDKIRIDGGTQMRVEIDLDVVSDYAEHLHDLPPAVVFHDGAEYWLGGGFHRYHAHRKAGAKTMDVEIRKGTVRDAILYAVSDNATHGLRRTNADKRKAVETLLRDEEWGKMVDREIARRCAVTHPFVASVRSSLETITSEAIEEPYVPRTYTTKHGTTATMNTANIGKGRASMPAYEPKAETVAAMVTVDVETGEVVDGGRGEQRHDNKQPSYHGTFRDSQFITEGLRQIAETIKAFDELTPDKPRIGVILESTRGIIHGLEKFVARIEKGAR